MKHSTPPQTEATLREELTRLTALAASFRAENRLRETNDVTLKADKAEWANDFSRADMRDEAAVEALVNRWSKLDLRQRHHESDFTRRRLCDEAGHELNAVAPLIKQAAQIRCREEAGIGETRWQARVLPIEQDREVQIALLQAVLNEVITDLRTLLEAKRGELLTAAERRDGVLRHGGIASRRLEPEEVASGVALT